MSLNKRRKKPEEHEEHPDERWMASYMDMVTVLMCMFIVLFAMSSVDAAKFEQLKNSLATGFGAESSDTVDTASGVVVPAEFVDEEGEGFTVLEQAEQEVAELEALRDKIYNNLAAVGLQDSVSFTIDERGLTIRLIGTQTFFATNSTALTSMAASVLAATGPVLAASPYSVSVEGHADGRPAAAPFPTNWELSSGRATGVLRYLVEATGVPAPRIGAVGYGSARPLAAGGSEADMATNRRVDIVALSNASEDVRALIPGVVSGALTSEHLDEAQQAVDSAVTEAAAEKAEADKEAAAKAKEAKEKKEAEKEHEEEDDSHGGGH